MTSPVTGATVAGIVLSTGDSVTSVAVKVTGRSETTNDAVAGARVVVTVTWDQLAETVADPDRSPDGKTWTEVTKTEVMVGSSFPRVIVSMLVYVLVVVTLTTVVIVDSGSVVLPKVVSMTEVPMGTTLLGSAEISATNPEITDVPLSDTGPGRLLF